MALCSVKNGTNYVKKGTHLREKWHHCVKNGTNYVKNGTLPWVGIYVKSGTPSRKATAPPA
ncbi:hypothetical protein [Hymenobacter algoricola]|uniref:Uncharacterized protein n=1 Tax=Hymenobacter algoricola TaxID=486267 RepID=A0ABP7MEJ3_9BACT